MADIFLSYDDKDRPRARALVEALEERGWTIFWDRSIPAGKTWWQAIGRALKGARCVVVLWSETAVHSTWVYEEADAGRTRGVLVPVFIDAVAPPIGFRSVQAVDLSAWDGSESSPAFRKLLADIGSVMGAAAESAEARSASEPVDGDEHADDDEEADEYDDYDSTRFYLLLIGALLGIALALYIWE